MDLAARMQRDALAAPHQIPDSDGPIGVAVASDAPSGDTESDLTASACPDMTRITRRVVKSQIFAVLSVLPVTARRPSGRKRRH